MREPDDHVRVLLQHEFERDGRVALLRFHDVFQPGETPDGVREGIRARSEERAVPDHIERAERLFLRGFEFRLESRDTVIGAFQLIFSLARAVKQFAHEGDPCAVVVEPVARMQFDGDPGLAQRVGVLRIHEFVGDDQRGLHGEDAFEFRFGEIARGRKLFHAFRPVASSAPRDQLPFLPQMADQFGQRGRKRDHAARRGFAFVRTRGEAQDADKQEQAEQTAHD